MRTPQETPIEPLWTHEQTAEFLNVSSQTLTRLGDAEEIAYHLVSARRRYQKQDIDDYLKRTRQPATAAA